MPVEPQKRLAWLLAVLAAALMAAASLAGAAEARSSQLLSGRVADVKDGDTIVVEDRVGQFLTVRLGGIDAPELKQQGGREARDALRTLLTGRSVHVEIVKMDRYGRYVGKVMLDDGTDVGLTMVIGGLAWWYRRYSHDQSQTDRAAYESAERDARSRRIGLWQNANPTPPWDYRQATSVQR